MSSNQKVDSHQKEIAEIEIRKQRETIDYDTVNYPIEYFRDKISQQEINNSLHWNTKQQSYFVESLLLGIPILNIVINNNSDEIEVIDGKQRLYTAINFINNNLILNNLKELARLNGFKFEDLLFSRQKKFKRYTVRAIVVGQNFDKSVWRLDR